MDKPGYLLGFPLWLILDRLHFIVSNSAKRWKTCSFVHTKRNSDVNNRVRDEFCVPLRMFVWTLVHHYDFGELLATDFIEYCRLYCSPQFYQTFANRLTSLPGASSERFAERLGMCSGKKIFITREGHFGMGLRPTREGDVLAIVFGCPMPMLLRPTEDVPPKFRLVGQAYVDNLMSGEAVMKWKDGKF